jgi:AraC-like DNA-binding protein
MYGLFREYAYFAMNYEMAFRTCMELDKALAAVKDSDFPDKFYYYAEIARQYYFFEEYEQARYFYEKIIENPALAYGQRILETAWNHLGLIYRNHYGDLEKSDSCFCRIISIKPDSPGAPSPTSTAVARFTLQDEHELWVAIAKGNLGTNACLRGDYDAAIPLLAYSVEKTVENNPFNYPYAIGKALTLSKIYIRSKQLPQAKHYIGRASVFFDKLRGSQHSESDKNNPDILAEYYQVQSLYYRALGDHEQALLHADSAALMRERMAEEFNRDKLHRVEQYAGQLKLDAERLRGKTYRQGLTAAVLACLALIALLTMLFRLYRQKQAAYQALTLKAQQWAFARTEPAASASPDAGSDSNGTAENGCPTPEQAPGAAGLPDATCRHYYDLLLQLMEESRLYSNSDITLDLIARRMSVNRAYLSQAVNRYAGGNFSTFVNEFRIREAVRLLSDAKSQKFSIEGIAFEAGFSDRKTFHRVFKKFTGLTPTAFRQSLPGK